ncbi:unnamed protein product [Leptidea sinapis]|uniref:Uncharacterized protein n=1 Tax=Leptidea sinapis TaxID=189913 RepID=A0A5E4Q6E8_9NEOP|nr:unnamed protein product [Leptidea sinapis]
MDNNVIVTRKMSRQADSQQLKVALQELKLSRELCNQLTSEREENEKILLEALENNTKLKSELSALHLQYDCIIEERNKLQMIIDDFDQCGAEYENTLKRNSILERELCDAHKQIAQMEEDRFSAAQETHSLFNELLSVNSVVKQVSVASNDVAGSVIDLTHDNTVVGINSVCNKKTSKVYDYLDKLKICTKELKNNRTKYENDNQHLESELARVEGSLRSITSLYDKSQEMIWEYSANMDELLKLSQSNQERFDSLMTNYLCDCQYSANLKPDRAAFLLTAKINIGSNTTTMRKKNNYKTVIFFDEIGKNLGKLLHTK